MSSPNSILKVVVLQFDLADVLEGSGELYVAAEGYSEIVKLKQPDGILETMIQRSSIHTWGNGIAIFQESLRPNTNPATTSPSNFLVTKYRVCSDGEVFQETIAKVGVVGPEGLHSRQLTDEQASVLLENLANSHLIPATQTEL